jgi:hypothetical protein
VPLWKRQGESSRWSGRDGRRAGVEEARASHLSNVGSGSEADGSDASAGNGAGAGRANPSRGAGVKSVGACQKLVKYST